MRRHAPPCARLNPRLMVIESSTVNETLSHLPHQGISGLLDPEFQTSGLGASGPDMSGQVLADG